MCSSIRRLAFLFVMFAATDTQRLDPLNLLEVEKLYSCYFFIFISCHAIKKTFLLSEGN